MEDTTSGRCYKRTEASAGDVGPDGNIVDELRERLAAAIGPTREGVDHDEQLEEVVALLRVAGVLS